MLLKNLYPLLDKMETIPLAEVKTVRLTDRVDSKYIAPVCFLSPILESAISNFRLQEINQVSLMSYATAYFDTPKLDMYLLHEAGKLNRQKVRIRSYKESNDAFLEIKSKNSMGRINKARTSLIVSHADISEELKEKADFLKKHCAYDWLSLSPSLSNSFNRITLVNNKKTERITIDMNLSLYNHRTKQEKSLDDIVIIELKQNGRVYSDFFQILNKMNLERTSFSKYCMGIMLTNPDIKSDRFQKRWTRIQEILNRL